MWDGNDTASEITTMPTGFYVGRGRGFGNMALLNKALPKVEPQSNGNQDDDWNDNSSGWNDNKNEQQNSKPEPSQFEDDEGWGNTNNSTWNNQNNYEETNKGNRFGSSRQEKNYSKTYPTNGYSKESFNNRSRTKKGGSGCFKCGEDGHMSRDCPNKKSGGGCYNCGEDGHMSRDCPTKKSSGSGGGRNCYKCKGEGHMARDCPNSDASDYKSGGSKTCHKCNEEGHFAKECPNADSGSRGRECRKCKQEGHFAKDCPNSDASDSREKGCFKCKEEGHFAKDCPNANIGEDGKPRPPPYIPPEDDDEETLFQGVPMGINFDKYDDISVDVSGKNPPPGIETFADSGLCQHLLKNIAHSKYTRPTPVQKRAIPIILKKRDLMACAQTGSGKTAAFLLPILNDMIPNPNLPNNANNDEQTPWAVIVAPTRELVIQIGAEARKFAYDTVVKTEILYGGTSMGYQYSRIKKGVHILVATPGRLLDFLEKGKVSFSDVKYFVLDEADRMLDMGFAPAIRKMVEHQSMPERGVRNTLMFSATFPEEIQKLAGEFLHDDYLFLTVGLIGAANKDVEQTFFNIGQYDKRTKLLDILKESGTDRTLVFVEQKRTADFLASHTSQHNIPTTSIHGDRLQREREEALRDFRTGKMPVLVATAVAARGLDIKDVRHVINYDLPQTIDEYVHRIGRTGRVGNLGKATSFYDSEVDQPLAASLKKILADANQEIPDWLHEQASLAVGSSFHYGGRGNFGGRDIRHQGGRGGGNRRNADSAFDNNFADSTPSFNQGGVEEDDDWS